MIPFENLSREHTSLLLKKYLSDYRTDDNFSDALFPFKEEAVNTIGELSKYNAAKILKMAYELLDKAADIEGQTVIDAKFVSENTELQQHDDSNSLPTIDAESIDLLKKAKHLE
jgi:hypothetical protein